MKPAPRALALACVALLVPACGDGDTGAQGPPGPPGSAVTSLSAGDGLVAAPQPVVDTGTLSVDFAGTGSAVTVARSDHDHDADYLALSGGTLSGALTVNGVVSGDGSGLTALDAGNLSAGTLPDARLGGSYGSSVALSNTGNSFTGSFTLGSPAVRYLSLPSTAFLPFASSVTYTGFPGRHAGGGNFGSFMAPVLLPQGASITGIVAVVLDNTDLASVQVAFARVDDAGTMDFLASGTSTVAGMAAAPQTIPLTPAGLFSYPFGVTNDTHAYTMLFQHGGNPADAAQLFRVRITYTVTQPLP